jgi:hypothetical protein
MYNGTGNYTVLEGIAFNESYKFSLFSYCTELGLHRYSIASAGATVSWGGVAFNCYNESSGLPIEFNVLISNKAGTQVYYGANLSGWQYINTTEIPSGDDICFYVSNSSGEYNSRMYYYDIESDVFYNLSFYLPVRNSSVPPLTSYLYSLHVQETVYYSGYALEQDVADVNVLIKRYVVLLDEFVEVAAPVTDASGVVNVYLIPGEFYKVFLNKSGYYNSTNDYIPAPPNEWGQTEEKLFKIVVLPSVTDEDDEVTRNIVLDATMYVNGSLYIEYSSSVGGDCNATVLIYEDYNYTRTLNATYNFTLYDNSFWYSPVNITREYEIWLYLNFTTPEYANYTKVTYVLPLAVHIYNATEIEEKITDVWGVWLPGFVNVFILFAPFFCILILLGKAEPGLGALGGGAWLLGCDILFTHLNALNLYVVAVFVAAIGVVLLLVKGGRVKL